MLNHLQNKILLCLLVAGFLSMTGCGTLSDLKADVSEKIFGKEPVDEPEPLTEIKETVSSKVLWHAKIGDATDFDFSPVVDAGYAYATSSVGEVVKLDIANGKQEWRISVGEKLTGGVGVGGSLVMVGTSRGSVYAYDISGKLLWKSKLSSEGTKCAKVF